MKPGIYCLLYFQSKTDLQKQFYHLQKQIKTLTWYVNHHLFAPPVAYVSGQSAVTHSEALAKASIPHSAALNI